MLRSTTEQAVRYINCGDWVESCTAVVETYAGEFEIIRWPLSGQGAVVPLSRTVAANTAAA
jgi:hypothetical protein